MKRVVPWQQAMRLRLRWWLDSVLRDRDPATVCLCFALSSLPMVMALWLLQSYALWVPSVRALYHAGGLMAAQALVGALLMWLVVVVATAWHRPERVSQRAERWSALTVTPVALVWLVLAIGHGLKDSGITMILVMVVATSRALFPLRVLQGWMALAVACLVVNEGLLWLGWVSYAPMLQASIHQGNDMERWWQVWQRVMFNMSVLPFGMMVFLVFGSLDRQREELENLVRTDVLTGLCNRREFMARFQQEVHRQERHGHALTLLMLDVDHFKRINDAHGHPAGDHVLMSLGSLLRGSVRQGVDVAARMGGEEFAVLLPETDALGGQSVARKISEALQRAELQWQGVALDVTLSAGVVEVRAGQSERALAEADHNLYQAKHQGRNRTVVSTVNPAPRSGG